MATTSCTVAGCKLCSGRPGIEHRPARWTPRSHPASDVDVTRSGVRSFADVTDVVETSSTTFVANLDPMWGFEDHPNGGYLQALMARAALRASGRRDVIAMNTSFLSSPRAGAVTVETEVLRRSPSTTQMRARLMADDEVRVEALLSLGELQEDAPVEWSASTVPVGGPAYDDCERHTPRLDVAPRVPLMHQIDLRIEPASLNYYTGRPRGLGELRGWLSLPAGEDFDSVSLVFAADVMPPATYDIEFGGWVPTFTMSTYVRSRPAPGPVNIVVNAQLVQGGKANETCTIRDSAGRVVVQSHQLAGVRLTPGVPGMRRASEE